MNKEVRDILNLLENVNAGLAELEKHHEEDPTYSTLIDEYWQVDKSIEDLNADIKRSAEDLKEHLKVLQAEDEIDRYLRASGEHSPSYQDKLYDLIFKADLNNLRKLQKIYPYKVKAVCNYKGIKL